MRMGIPRYRKVTMFSQVTKSHCPHGAEAHPNTSSSVEICHTHVNISYCSKIRNCSICPWEMKARTSGKGTVTCGGRCGEADRSGCPWKSKNQISISGRLPCPADTLKLLFSWTDVEKWETSAVSLDLFGSKMDLRNYLVQLPSASQKSYTQILPA